MVPHQQLVTSSASNAACVEVRLSHPHISAWSTWPGSPGGEPRGEQVGHTVAPLQLLPVGRCGAQRSRSMWRRRHRVLAHGDTARVRRTSPRPPSAALRVLTGRMTAEAPPTTSSDDRNWAMAAHLGSFLAAWFALGLLAPLAVLLFKADASGFVRRHSVESLNFQINALFYTVVFALLIFVLIGLVLLPLYGLFYLVCVVSASVKASEGADYRYPLTVRFIS